MNFARLAEPNAAGTKFQVPNVAQRSYPQSEVQDVLNDVFTPFCGINIQTLIDL